MKQSIILSGLIAAALTLGSGAAYAGKYQDATQSFKSAHESADFFNRSYAYAVFPTVGQGGFVVGGAYGSGRVYAHGKHVGNTSVTQLSVGWQAGAQAYSENIVKGGLMADASLEGEKFSYTGLGRT